MTSLTERSRAPARAAGDAAPLPRRWAFPWWLAGMPFILFITLPLLALFLQVPLAHTLDNLRAPEVYQALGLSLTTTAAATLLTILFGTPVALLMARREFPFKPVLDTLIDLPTVLPPAVAGVALLLAFGRRGLFGAQLDALGISLAFSTVAVVIAQTFIASPFYIKAAILGFGSVNRELQEAAALDGASRWGLFRFLIVPLSWASLAGGAVMTFARALGEFGATIIFAGNFPGRTQTMPLAIYIGFEVNLDVALTLAVILIGFSFATLIIVKWLVRQA